MTTLKDTMEETLREAISSAGYPPEGAAVTVARNPKHGDFSTSAPILAGRASGRDPFSVAEEISSRFSMDGVEAVPARPGFINFTVSGRLLAGILTEIAARGSSWGSFDAGRGRRALVEHTSANPTGPLHVGHGRGAVVGDVTARLLGRAGWDVETEYYVNDAGRQVEALGESVLSHMEGRGDEGTPEDGYRGDYITELAEDARASGTKRGDLEAFAAAKILGRIEATLERMKIRFDSRVSERVIREAGGIEDVRDALRAKGLLYEAERPEGADERKRRRGSGAARHAHLQEGGLFVRTSRFDDTEDRILIRADGRPTYFAADIAYHGEKFRRGYDLLVDVWGADHGAHAPRMKSALRALGYDAGRLRVILVQMVRLISGGEEVKMSKRAGTLITLDELIEEVGADATRFFFLMRSPTSRMDFDMDLAKKEGIDNPVYYIRYAHARACSILERAARDKLVPKEGKAPEGLEAREETDLMRELMMMPIKYESAAERMEPHMITAAALDLAARFHRYQTAGKKDESLRIVRPSERDISSERLALVRCARDVMRGLGETMGITLPERM